ncbi:MAG: hypothetical protein WC273_05480 [Dehalococcoidia bacterium]
MIPTLLLVGFIAGLLPKGWIAAGLAAAGWPIILVALDVGSGPAFVLAAGALGAANTALGLLVGAGARQLLRRLVRGAPGRR